MSDTQETINYHLLKHRFRGYLPVIIDVETAGLNAKTDALLELKRSSLTALMLITHCVVP